MVFVVGVGWQYGPGASGGSLGMGFLGGSALGLRPWPGRGIGDSWMLFLWRRHAVLLGMPVPADVGCQPGGRTVPGLVRGGGGGVWGSGDALPPAWGYGWAWGAWVLVGVPPGAWVGACAWARLWCGGLRCIGASAGGGVQQRRGIRALPGCLIVLCSLGTDWMMGWGSFSSAVGSGGPPRAAMGPGLDGPGPPALGRFGVTGVPMGVSGGACSRGGGYFAPSDVFLPIPKASLLPLHHTNT